MKRKRMSWVQLLDRTRLRELVEKEVSVKAKDESRSEYERDRDRTIYSAPVRRLIGKTQVFPLDPNDHVRTRLVHSLEVSTVAEGLASQVVRDVISKKENLEPEQSRAISKIAETCGLLHDLGNPPFGHAGELAIASWFEKKLSLDKDFFTPLGGEKSQRSLDFLRFEGNAQTMRIVTNTHLLCHDYGLNLTCATTAAARKYLASSVEASKKSKDHALTKPGHFFSENEILQRVAQQTGTDARRHPITFLVEAADDIVYSVVDLEDGVKKRILSWRQVQERLEKECKGLRVFDEAIERTHRQVGPSASDSAMAQAFRVNAISETVRAAVRMFEYRYDDIMNGRYDSELVRDSRYDGLNLIGACKDLLGETVFLEEDILRLELRGRRVLHDLLDLFWEGASTFLIHREESTKTYAGKLYLLIAGSDRALFRKRIKMANPDETMYCALQLVTDFVSGMTDGYACRLHKDLMNG